MNEDIKYWLDLAEYDLGTAEAMLAAARYTYVLFMCQQAIEKIVKAHVVKTTESFPPRLHNLLRLLTLAKLETTDENKKFLEKLSYYYLETRYPEEKKKISAQINKTLAEEYLMKTKELFGWLKEKLL